MSGREVVSQRVTASTSITGIRTNSIRGSETFGDAAADRWNVVANVTVTENQILSPNRTLTGDKIAETAANSTHNVANRGPSNAGDSTSVNGVFSTWLKKGERTRAFLSGAGSSTGLGTNYIFAQFDLDKGVVVNSGAVGLGTLVGSGIEAWIDGWYRCWISGSPNTAATTHLLYLSLGDGVVADPTSGYIGSAGSSIYAWGAQFEIGALVPSAYIPTTTASVTGPGTRARLASWSAVGSAGGAVVNLREGSSTGFVRASLDVPVGATSSLSSPGNTQDIVFLDGMYFELASGAITGFTLFFEK